MALVTHWKNTTTAGVPSLISVGFENVGPKPLPREGERSADRQSEKIGHPPATMAQTNKVSPKTGMMTVLAMNMYLRLLTCSHSNGNWTMMKRKKQRSSELVT
jgi:hypothetical protein